MIRCLSSDNTDPATTYADTAGSLTFRKILVEARQLERGYPGELPYQEKIAQAPNIFSPRLRITAAAL